MAATAWLAAKITGCILCLAATVIFCKTEADNDTQVTFKIILVLGFLYLAAFIAVSFFV